MGLLDEHRAAKRDERLRRVLALRAMAVTGMSQRQIADALDITQLAVSQQLKFASELDDVHPEVLLEGAAPVLKALAAEHGYSRLAVFGSVARREARKDSDIDLLVEAPEGTSSFDFIRFKQRAWRGSVQAPGSSLSFRLPTLVVWLSYGLRGSGVARARRGSRRVWRELHSGTGTRSRGDRDGPAQALSNDRGDGP